jgi:hypothetical protein
MTAVEWLIEKIETGKIEIVYSDKIHSIRCLSEFVKAAIEMEKQQIIKAANLPIEKRWFDATLYKSCGEQYYNETYKK